MYMHTHMRSHTHAHTPHAHICRPMFQIYNQVLREALVTYMTQEVLKPKP